MLDISYVSYLFAEVTDLNDFFKSPLPEIPKIKSLINAIRLMYSLSPKSVVLEVSQNEDRVYRISMKDKNKRIFGWFCYLPLEKRLDLFDSSYPSYPLIQWKNRKPVTQNYEAVFVHSGISKVFDRLLNIC